jgi:hypothetical protein
VAELGLPLATPSELAAAFSDLLLLNVYPYGTVFSEPEAELNGPGAEAALSRYADQGYRPRALFEVGAPDHLGLALGFLDHLEAVGAGDALAAAYAEALAWAPAVCAAVDHEPGAHPFYRALAARTAASLLARSSDFGAAASEQAAQSPPPEPGPLPDAEGEVRLRDLVRYFLAPARCGAFLSRNRLGRLAQELGLAVPFGSRFDVAEALFQAAGASDRLPDLLDAIDGLLSANSEDYAAWAAAYPAWQPLAQSWLSRLSAARQQLALMRAALA